MPTRGALADPVLIPEDIVRYPRIKIRTLVSSLRRPAQIVPVVAGFEGNERRGGERGARRVASPSPSTPMS